MKKLFHILFFLAYSLLSYSQITFENGFFINDKDERVECLIKNMEWKNNPTKFKYKINESSETEEQTIEHIKEFGIYNSSKYIRAHVKIDRSTNDINKLNTDRNPSFQEELLFLSVLVEGEASLYQYEDDDLKRFFYRNDDSDITQLVYKSYLIDGNKIRTNNYYKQQLFLNLVCKTISQKELRNLNYYKSDLKEFFIKYNLCKDSDYICYSNTQKKDVFSLSLRPGLNINNLLIENHQSNSDNADLGHNLGFRFGIESEIIIPFNKNKWSIIFEPTYQYFKSSTDTDKHSITTEYKSLEIPVGVRYYLFLNEKSKLFFNASAAVDISLNSTIKYETGYKLNINSGSFLAFGFGYKYSNKFCVETRYHMNKNLLSKYISWDTKYRTLSIILGYSIF